MAGYKNLGPDVSQSPQAVTAGGGSFSEEERSYESVVFNADRPVVDWELNLQQAVSSPRMSAFRTLPSCFLTGDFLERPDLGDGTLGSYAFLPAIAGNANKFRIRAANLVVNGWPIGFEYSGTATAGLNEIVLPAPPGSGIVTNLVILEVWRALVKPASSANKSLAGQILRHGNAKAPDSPNANLSDDIVDPTYAQPTEGRVQIQYRYRVITNVDVTASTFLDGPQTTANTVPYLNMTGVDGDATVESYLPVSDAPGLWRAGSGNSVSAALFGTVDGYMYAIPVCAVVRRNTAAFDEGSNRNGAPLIGAGSNPRPDGLYADQIVADDVLDMRHGLATSYDDVLEKNFQYLLMNSLRSGSELFTDGLSTVGGTAFTAGDNISATGQHAGQADGVRAHFSDRSVTEPCVHKVAIVGLTSTTVNLNSITFPWGTSANLTADAPAGTRIAGVSHVRLETGSNSIDLLDPAASPRVKSIVVSTSTAAITFTGMVTGDLYVDLLVTYPRNYGVQRNVVSSVGAWFPPPASMAAWVDASFFSVGSNPAGRYSLPQPATGSPVTGRFWWVDPDHRELTAFIPAQDVTNTYFANSDGELYIPESISEVSSNTAPYVVAGFVYEGGYTVVGFAPVPPAGTAISLTYAPFRAPPKLGGADMYTVWYKTRAVQSLRPPAGNQTLKLVPRAVSKHVHVVLSGSGSPDSPIRWGGSGVQIPVPRMPAGSYPEAVLDSPKALDVVGLGYSGHGQVPVSLPWVQDVSQVQLYRGAMDDVVDGDGRRFWPKSDNGSTPVGAPTVFGQPLAGAIRHKSAYPTLCELVEDFPGVGVRGTLFMVVFCKWTDYGREAGAAISSSASDSGAAVFRLRGGFLSPRRSGS